MQKGLGVIVGVSDKNGNLHTDSICNCDANFLSIGTPVVLQNADFSKVPADRVLYLCGHGSYKKRTISGYTMKQIADLLIDAKYTGEQLIYIASCHSLKKKHGRTFADELIEALSAKGVRCTCKALAHDTSIVYEKDGESILVSKNFRGLNSQFFSFQRKLFADDVQCDTDSLRQDYKKEHENVCRWNETAANNRLLAWLMSIVALESILLSLATAVVFYLILSNAGLSMNEAMNTILVWIATEYFTFTSHKKICCGLWTYLFTLWLSTNLISLVILRLAIAITLAVFFTIQHKDLVTD